MQRSTLPTRVTAALLSALLFACGATRHAAPANTRELTHFVLFIRELPDGTVTHSWQRAEELNLAEYRFLSRSRSGPRGVLPVVARPRDCDEENRECVRECKSRPLGRGFGHITSGKDRDARKDEYCRAKCWQAYRDCNELQELKPQEFTAIDSAVDWLKRNRKAVLVGSVVVVAGVAFIVLSAGAGLVVLAPAVLLAEPATPAEPWMAEVSP
ncbi:hypothetical protein [Pyxidicoccus xibeiensis]|uniref:hypothetical protein n=1 Tax=Pyxidicoccus xibeiensis TaxID=2906759 RepID=UPI0020A7340C|nr:hypothetical protein [Pyxidicoccus xibeiensis]MCP3139898.1 hypothetical protein [Pyxidicoccus xibeiensis]